MRAVLCERLGLPEDLLLEEIDDPKPKEGEALIDIADGHEPIVLGGHLQKPGDQVGAGTARPEDEYLFHGAHHMSDILNAILFGKIDR